MVNILIIILLGINNNNNNNFNTKFKLNEISTKETTIVDPKYKLFNCDTNSPTNKPITTNKIFKNEEILF